MSALYSDDGEYFAFSKPNEVCIIKTTKECPLEVTIPVADVYSMNFSPKGSFLCLWCKPILENRESGIWSKNIKIFNVKSKKIISEWHNKHQSGWLPQFTRDEKIFAKNVNNKEIHFFDVNDPSNPEEVSISKPVYRYKSEDVFQNFQMSPGLNSSVAVFLPEKSGKPASVRIYNVPNFNQPVCQKNFFKADKCQLKWNNLGTALLALASTDHDTSNKSYYGESNLYLLGIVGSYNSRIDLKKEGPIHDINWSPSAKEFAVSYGYMPAETTFFDARGNLIHSLPTAPRNTILYSPHARFVLVAGFGNLQGTVDVYDRHNKFTKISTFEASNTSVCEWSPCGRFIITATTSPRLRVDNGCKIWHASGQLIYYKEYNELYAIGWKPQDLSQFPPLRQLEPAPEPHESSKKYLASRESKNLGAEKKPSGAYRPPHARNSAANAKTTTLYQRELQVNALKNSASSTNGKEVPGAIPVTANAKESKSASKNKKKRDTKKLTLDNPPSSTTQNSVEATSAANQTANEESKPAEDSVDGGSTGAASSLEDKRIRSLLKKLRAIESLKMKQANNEPLENTQLSKMTKEEEIRKELSLLGWSD